MAAADAAPAAPSDSVQSDMNDSSKSSDASDDSSAPKKVSKSSKKSSKRVAKSEVVEADTSATASDAENQTVSATASASATEKVAASANGASNPSPADVGTTVKGSSKKPLIEKRDSLVYASRTQKQMMWSLSTKIDDDSIDHFEIMVSNADSSQHLGDAPATARSFDLKSEDIAASAKIYIRAVEKGGGLVHISNVVGTGRDIALGLEDGQKVTSPIHVVASALSDQPVTAVQVYLDDLLVSSQQFAHIDTKIAAEPGTRQLTITGWDMAGNEFKKSISVVVQRAVPDSRLLDEEQRRFPVVRIFRPSNQGTVSASTAHLVAEAAARRPIVRVEVYRDGEKIFHTRNLHLDAQVPLSVGGHRLEVRAFDQTGKYYSAVVDVERVPSNWAWDRKNAATYSDIIGTDKDSKVQ
jgi:hypothetical protein